jgi:anti-anti-sigma factor
VFFPAARREAMGVGVSVDTIGGMPVQKWSDRIWVAKLADVPAFGEDLDYLLEHAPRSEPVPDIVLDFGNVSHLNSSNLSHLLRLRKQTVDRSARLRLASPSDALWVLFISTGLDKVFSFTRDTSTALAELQLAQSEDRAAG